MKTSLIDGTRVPHFDKDLLPELPSGIPSVGVIDPILLGVENDEGEIYRLIETADDAMNTHLIHTLQRCGYDVDVIITETSHSLQGIIRKQKRGVAE